MDRGPEVFPGGPLWRSGARLEKGLVSSCAGALGFGARWDPRPASTGALDGARVETGLPQRVGILFCHQNVRHFFGFKRRGELLVRGNFGRCPLRGLKSTRRA